MSGSCQYLEWDTNFFNVRIARVTQPRLTLAELEEVFDWCRANTIACLYFLSDADDPETVRLVEKHGFNFVDIRLTLQWQATTPQQRAETAERTNLVTVRPARSADVPHLETITRLAHTNTRFHFDPHFSHEAATALYETWIRRSCDGYADAVLIAALDDQPVGYITCHLPKDAPYGQIGLVGVAQQVQGRRIGSLLLDTCLDWFTAQHIGEVRVVTQGRNINAQRLYQRGGFLTHSLQLWYHKWFAHTRPEGS